MAMGTGSAIAHIAINSMWVVVLTLRLLNKLPNSSILLNMQSNPNTLNSPNMPSRCINPSNIN